MGYKTVYKYQYKSGRPVSRTETYYYDDGDKYTDTQTFTFTKMKVNKKYVNVIKAQQWALLNQNMNKAFGPVTLYI